MAAIRIDRSEIIKMQAVTRLSIVQQVANSIKDYLFSDGIKEGDKLPTEMELCSMLGVGRGTVRESIRILETLGYVEIRPGKGTFVCSTKEIGVSDVVNWFSAHEIETRDLYEVRMAIEPYATRLAVERCTETDIVHLKMIHVDLLKAVDVNNVSQIAICDELFHKYIVECSKNRLLVSIAKQINAPLKEFRSKTFYIRENAENVRQPHAAILDAFVQRNPNAGEQGMIVHLQCIENDFRKLKK
jgi:GntR family transcriptional regulator, transcriptional repressor for pyruvate dehydrogenase complex